MHLFQLTYFNIFVTIFLSICTKANTRNSKTSRAITLREFNDVPLQHFGSNPCQPFTPKMPDFRAPGRRISEVKCFEYVWRTKAGRQNFEQGRLCYAQKKIHFVIGGRVAKQGEYAHVGAVGWRGVSGNWIFKCGASLISEKFALTAAHCSKLRKVDADVAELVPKIVRLGAKTITNFDDDRKSATDGRIKLIIVHPLYKAPLQYYDIALMQFHNEIEFGWLVHPSCLGNTFQYPEKAEVAGWGVVNLETLNTSPTLQVAGVSLIKSQYCDNLLRSKFNRNWRGSAKHQICAGHLAGGIDTCQGDSGGPLSWKINNNLYSDDPTRWSIHRIVGVTSFGYGCGRANTPGVYTRVASFINWIESIVWAGN